MISELKLLMLRDESAENILSAVSQNTKDRLTKWCGKDAEEALLLYIWCSTDAQEVFETKNEADAFIKKAKECNVESETLYSLYESHFSLNKDGEDKKTEKTDKGRFIVFEGIDGAGKTTHLARLAKSLTDAGRKVYTTAEPTQGAIGGLIRDTLSGYTKRGAEELAALFLSDRIHHNLNPLNGIKKMLDDGYDVLCDRYYYSSLAYQGIDTSLPWLCSCNLECEAITKPDVCVFLDLPPRISAERISSTRATTDIYENEETIRKIKRRFADVFELLNESDNIQIVNTNRPIDAVGESIYKIISEI